MSHGLINLTLPVIIQEIEYVLEEYPEHPYQAAFSLPDLRQKLLAQVLSQVPNCHIVERTQEVAGNAKVRHLSLLQERLRMEMIIRGSILHILHENADLLNRYLPNA